MIMIIIIIAPMIRSVRAEVPRDLVLQLKVAHCGWLK